MQRIPYRPALVVVTCALGFLLALAFNTSRGMAEARPARANDLAGVVRDLESQRSDLRDRLEDRREQLGALEEAAAADVGVRESFTRELGSARAAAGLTPVRGPGVEVVLGDGSEVAAGEDPNDYLIHDTDIAACVNAMASAGAEAIEINGERIVATTPIRCAGTTVLVNAVRLGSPYVIKAIGDPAKLEEAVMGDPTASLLFTTYRSQFGLDVSLASRPELEVAAFRGSLSPRSFTDASGGDE